MIGGEHAPVSRRYLFFSLLAISIVVALTSSAAPASARPGLPAVQSTALAWSPVSRPLPAARNGLRGQGGSSAPAGALSPTPTCGPALGVVPSPNGGPHDNSLYSVSAPGPNDVWAVGISHDSAENQHTLTEHWDGSQWSIVSSPNGSPAGDYLLGVAAAATNDVWAVGSTSDGSGGTRALIEHWDGTGWTIVPSANPGTAQSEFYAVTALAGHNAWAAGWSTDADGKTQTLIEHWDGTAWSVVPSPNLSANYNQFYAISGRAPDDVWAAGGHGDGEESDLSLIEHWNGSSWQVVPSPSPGISFNRLEGVTAIAANDAWVVGGADRTDDIYLTLTEHWNGSSWQVVPSPNPPSVIYTRLVSVSGAASGNVWATGFHIDQGAVDATLAEHWDGTAWTMVPAGGADLGDSGLFGVAALSATDVWAVGKYGVDRFSATLTMHYGDQCSTPGLTATRTSTAVSTPTNAASPTSTSTRASTATPAPATSTTSPTLQPSATATATAMRTSTAILTLTSTPQATYTAPPEATSTATETPCSARFTDIQPSDYFYQAVSYLYCRQYISGYTDGTFRPYNDTTRGQLSKIVVLAEGWQLSSPANPTFVDVPPGSAFFPYVETAYAHGVVSGYADQTFRPNNSVTRGQLSKIVVLAQGWPINRSGGPHFSDVLEGSAFYDYVETAFNHNIISGYAGGTFRPGNRATRGQLAKIVYNALTAP